MISWPIAIALMAVAFTVGLIVARRRSDSKVVWSEAKPAQPTPDVMALIQSGRKIDAIKLYRELHGTGLKEAKDAIESLERTWAH